ncbi:MAG: germination protein YpeB, partial [Oscillospiraceae bacterium]|nr:germination protein YpeB [Oscillospiraceae bacterium]
KALAAAFAGAEVQQLKEEYRYAGTEGRMCYSAGDTLICVSPAGVESLGQTRLVSEIKLSVQQAEAIAENYLKTMGFEKLKLSESSPQGAVSVMKFAAEENGVIWPDN